jgi:hypothetical protein
MKMLLRAIGGVALTVVAIPVALIAGIRFKDRKCSPEKLASELKALAAGDMSYWDQLESVSIRDQRLEAIRQEAMAVALPFRPSDRAKLVELALRAEAL